MVKASYKKQKNIIKNKELIDTAFALHINSVKISKGETLDHAVAKMCLCHEAINMGHIVVTEVKFLTGGKADIFLLDVEDGEVWEVLGSETAKMLEKKNYPCKIISFKARDVINQNLRIN